MNAPTDATLLTGFESWLTLERGLSAGTVPHYTRAARRILELVPRDAWESVDALRPVIESFSLPQRNIARTGARRFKEYLKEKHEIVLSPPPTLPRGGTRRVPSSSVILALGYLVDRAAPTVVCGLTWDAVCMDGSIQLPGGGMMPPHPETLFALAELAAWRPAHASTDALVPGKGGGGAPPVPAAQLRQWLTYRSEALGDAQASAKIRKAFSDPSSLRFPIFSRGGSPRPDPTAFAGEPEPTDLARSMGIKPVPSPGSRGGELPDLMTATTLVSQEQ